MKDLKLHAIGQQQLYLYHHSLVEWNYNLSRYEGVELACQ